MELTLLSARPRADVALAAGAEAPALRLLQELPGIADVVWAILARVDPQRDPVRLVFTSAERRSGNSVLAAATAIALLRHVRVPVCLIEADVEHPALARYLGLREAGLSDVLDRRIELQAALQSPAGCPGLYVLAGGTPRKPVSGEFATQRMRELLAQVGALGGYLVVDAPCLPEHLGSRQLLRYADAALLVLRAGSTRADAATFAHRILLESRTPLLGSIFNACGPVRGSHAAAPYQLSTDERVRASAVVAAQSAAAPAVAAAAATNGATIATNGASAGATNGATTAVNGTPPGATGAELAGEHEREVELLERRIAKLTALLAQTEADLQRLAAAGGTDDGLASIYRSVQGLSATEEALAFKRDLMGKIFQSNLELRHALERRS